MGNTLNDWQKDSSPFARHLREASWRGGYCLVSFALTLVCCSLELSPLVYAMTTPFREKQCGSLIFIELWDFWYALIILTFQVSSFWVVPLCGYHIWAFFSPSLTTQERLFSQEFLYAAALIYLSCPFITYYGSVPFFLTFFHQPAQSLTLSGALPSLACQTKILAYVRVVSLCFRGVLGSFMGLLGLIFCLRCRWLTPALLKMARGYILFSSLLGVALLAPPDPLSQVLGTLSVWLVYETSLFLSLTFAKRDAKKEMLFPS